VDDFLDDWQAWHDAREARLRSPRGWLAITAMHWLTGEPQRFDDVPGEWHRHGAETIVVLHRGETLAVGGNVLTGGVHALGPLGEEGLSVAFGDAEAEVADRDGTTIVRPRHPESRNLLAYGGTPCFPPDPCWRIAGRFEPYPAHHATSESAEEVAVGEVVFPYGGAEHRLVAWGEEDGSLWILFRDATSGVTTYPANRQLLAEPPAADGTVHLDFNRAYNMPCAYTDFATCPVAPAANTLPFAVEAGEQLPSTVSV